MRILSFDPGHSTGVACIDETGEWRFGMTVDIQGLEGKDFFRYLTGMARPDVVVVEEPPKFARDDIMLRAYGLIKQYFTTAGYPVETVNPGQWKGMVTRDKISGAHQNDAAGMGQWYWRSRLVNNKRLFE